jgi:hypothetical protein
LKKPSKKVVQGWGYKCLGSECDENGNVKKIWCTLCREYVGNLKHNKKGVAKITSGTFVKGTTVIKKQNFNDHVQKSRTHSDTITRLLEHHREESTSSSQSLPTASSTTNPTGAPRQTTLLTFIQNMNRAQHLQLTRKI